MLDSCKVFGTLPFAHLARSGFIAVTQLKEAAQLGWLSPKAVSGFWETIKTVSHELSEDAWLTSSGDLSWEDFVERYSHLRPGTYDITSPSYGDDPERFLRPIIAHAQPPKVNQENLEAWNAEKKYFFMKLRAMGLQAQDCEFEHFLKNAIEGRGKI